ncbi:SH3 domain-containing protein [Eubacteriales bacterium OttesenSCG-928-A19]|nr:SH3 domain-containing protein [Eubacteriales bacterium OttesenSCG-928-A19]
MKRLITMAIILISMIATSATAEGGQTYYVATSTTSVLNIREQPTTESKILTTMERGETIIATGEMRGLWVQLQYESHGMHSDGTHTTETITGWAMISMLSMEEPYSNKIGTIVGDGRVRLRCDPDGEFLKWVQPGDEVSVLAIIDFNGSTWYRIRSGDERGFVMSDFLELA